MLMELVVFVLLELLASKDFEPLLVVPEIIVAAELLVETLDPLTVDVSETDPEVGALVVDVSFSVEVIVGTASVSEDTKLNQPGLFTRGDQKFLTGTDRVILPPQY